VSRERVEGCVSKEAGLAALKSIAGNISGTIPFVCKDWANWKVAYCFLSDEHVSAADIPAGHFSSIRDRFAATDGLVLVLHDTTEHSYQRENTQAIVMTQAINRGRDKADRLRTHTVWGLFNAFEPGRYGVGPASQVGSDQIPDAQEI
jgi:hypothetical protein